LEEDVEMSVSRVILLASAGLFLLVVFVPGFRHELQRQLTGLTSGSETITLPTNRDSESGPSLVEAPQELEIVTLLGFDAIPAILDPVFVEAAVADREMKPTELVLGLSINGDSRAYSIPMLSAHEIVNDVVGGEPVAVTW
jgi:hypothetical protein